jgi:hypothetical protein
LQENQKINQAAIGRNGKKNCLVTGNIKLIIKHVAISVFNIGPGSCMMLRQKIPSTASPKYWKSYRLH